MVSCTAHSEHLEHTLGRILAMMGRQTRDTCLEFIHVIFEILNSFFERVGELGKVAEGE